MEDQGDYRRTDAVEDRGDESQSTQVCIEGRDRRHDEEIGRDECPASCPSPPEPASQVGNEDSDLYRQRSRQRLADRDGFAHLLGGQPATLADELPLHLPNECHRSAKPQKPEAQEVAYERLQPGRATVGLHLGWRFTCIRSTILPQCSTHYRGPVTLACTNEND